MQSSLVLRGSAIIEAAGIAKEFLATSTNSVVYLKAKRTFNLADTGENQMDPHQSSGSFSQADQLRHHMEVSKSSLSTQESECRKIAQKAMDGFGTIPRTKSFELYLVRGIAIPSGGSEKDARVIFPPEFIFVLDVNMESSHWRQYFLESSRVWRPRLSRFLEDCTTQHNLEG